MLDKTGLIIAEGVGEAARITRVALTKAATDMADAIERGGIVMTAPEALRFYAKTVTEAWEGSHAVE